MVVWVFASCGEAELGGVIPFLKENFTSCTFSRRMPAKAKPGPRPPKDLLMPKVDPRQSGLTGSSLAKQIKKNLEIALLSESCDLILIIDDLDCRDADEQHGIFNNLLDAVESAKDIPRIIGFAAPELEAWLIADWTKTFARYKGFRRQAHNIRGWLIKEANLSFDAPESYSTLDTITDACKDKLSSKIIEACKQIGTEEEYSKATHSALLLTQIRPDIVANHCPQFRALRDALAGVCK